MFTVDAYIDSIRETFSLFMLQEKQEKTFNGSNASEDETGPTDVKQPIPTSLTSSTGPVPGMKPFRDSLKTRSSDTLIDGAAPPNRQGQTDARGNDVAPLGNSTGTNANAYHQSASANEYSKKNIAMVLLRQLDEALLRLAAYQNASNDFSKNNILTPDSKVLLRKLEEALLRLEAYQNAHASEFSRKQSSDTMVDGLASPNRQGDAHGDAVAPPGSATGNDANACCPNVMKEHFRATTAHGYLLGGASFVRMWNAGQGWQLVGNISQSRQ